MLSLHQRKPRQKRFALKWCKTQARAAALADGTAAPMSGMPTTHAWAGISPAHDVSMLWRPAREMERNLIVAIVDWCGTAPI